MSRLAWFSPMPPARTGVAVSSAEVVTALRAVHDIDVYVDEPIAAAARQAGDTSVRSAHDFVWRHRRAPYDLTVYQVGNSSGHDFLWPYLFQYPGLTVLHDAHLHHARAAHLLRLRRPADYRAEFTANHPAAPLDAAELAVAGLDSHLYYEWPMVSLVVRASRLAAVHADVRQDLQARVPGAEIEMIRLAHGERIDAGRASRAAAAVRARHALAADAVLFVLAGGLTREKRVPQVLQAFESVLPYVPHARLVLAGGVPPHYDVEADILARRLSGHVTVTGHVSDDEFTEYVAAADVSINLRWPTARETSGPWLRAIAAGRPTITTDLAHTALVPSLDPRSWTAPPAFAGAEPVTVAIDLADEVHSLRLAMRRLGTDAGLRARLSRAAAAWWEAHHAPTGMIEDYARAIARAIGRPAPAVTLPPHLRGRADSRLRELLQPFGVPPDVWSRI